MRFAEAGWARLDHVPWTGCYDLATVSVTFAGKTLGWMLGDAAVPMDIQGLDTSIDVAAGTERWINPTGVHWVWHWGHCP